MYSIYADRSEASSRRHSPSTSGSNTPNSFARGTLFNDKVSLPPIGSMFTGSPTDDYDSRRNSLPYPPRVPAGASQWFQGLNDGRSSAPDSPATGSPTFTSGSYSSTSTAPTTVKSSPGASPFSDKLSLPAAPLTSGRDWSAPLTIPVPPSTETTSSAPSASPTPQSDSPPASAPPQRRRGKLPKHVTETLRTWLLSHADHPYPTEEEKKMLCNVTSLTLSQVSNWMINARRRILVPASKQQAALNATTGPYLGMARSSAATDLARANRQSLTIPHSMPAPTHSLPPSMDPYSGAYTLPHPHLGQPGELHQSSYGSLSTPAPRATRGFTYLAPSLHPPLGSYYGSGLNSFNAPSAIPSGSSRYYGDDSHFSSSH